MLAVARFALDVGDQTLGGQRREDALVIDFDDVDLFLVEQLHHLEQRPGPVLETDAQPRDAARAGEVTQQRSEEHTSELQSLMRNSYAVFCLKKKKTTNNNKTLLRRHH